MKQREEMGEGYRGKNGKSKQNEKIDTWRSVDEDKS